MTTPFISTKLIYNKLNTYISELSLLLLKPYETDKIKMPSPYVYFKKILTPATDYENYYK